jgi:hypothetical protein
MKEKNKQTKKQNKTLICNYIKDQVNDYNYEQQINKSISYCPCECCDGFLPITLIDNIPNNLLCYVITRTH